MSAAVYRLAAHDFLQLRPENILALLGRWQQVFASLEAEWLRFVFRAVPLSLEEPILRARKRVAAAPDDAAARHTRQYLGLLESAARGDAILGLAPYLVLPRLRPTEAQAAAGLLSTGLGVRAMPLPALPPLLPTRYRVRATHLLPESGNHPLCAILASWDMAGQWDWGVLDGLLNVGYPVDVALVLRTYHGAAAYTKLDSTRRTLQNVATQVGRKTKLSHQEQDLLALEQSVVAGQALHHAGVAILVRGSTLDELNERQRQLAAQMAGQLKLQQVTGLQSELFRAYFTGADEFPAPLRLLHNVTSAGAALLCGPLGLRRRTSTGGVLWGYSRQTPFFWDGFGPRLNEPNHGIILGATGSGKTVSMGAIALRELNLAGSQVIVMEPMGHSRRMVQAVGAARAVHTPLSLRSLRVNPLELLYEDPAEQGTHITTLLRLLLKRALTEPEEIAVDKALPLIYTGVETSTPAVNQPRLEDLARALRLLSGEAWVRRAGEDLAGILEERYVRGSLAGVFNIPTQQDWRLEGDLVAFDFSGMPDDPALLRLGYYLVLSAIQREAFRQARSRRRIVLIDEFRVMSAEPLLAGRVAQMFKTFRTLGVGVWAMEQDVFTFTGLDQPGAASLDTTAGFYMLANATFIVAFAQRTAEAVRILQRQRPQLTDEHAAYLMSLRSHTSDSDDNSAQDKGRGLIVLDNEVYPLKIELTKDELLYLAGS